MEVIIVILVALLLVAFWKEALLLLVVFLLFSTVVVSCGALDEGAEHGLGAQPAAVVSKERYRTGMPRSSRAALGGPC